MLLGVAIFCLLGQKCVGIDFLRVNRAAEPTASPTSPILSIGYAPLSEKPGPEVPTCLKITERSFGLGKAWAEKASSYTDVTAAVVGLFKAVSPKLENLLLLVGAGGTLTSPATKKWLEPDSSRCAFAGPIVSSKATTKLSWISSVKIKMDNAARGDTTKSDPCYAPDIIVDFQKAVKAVDVLASHLLDEGVNEAERAFYEHVYSYYGSSALQQHAAQCPGDWAGSYASETERTGDLTWDAWAAVSKAATCRKWQTDVFPELAKQVKAAGKEIREYFNWALQLCYREDAVNDGCPVDKPVGAHLAKTVHKVRALACLMEQD